MSITTCFESSRLSSVVYTQVIFENQVEKLLLFLPRGERKDLLCDSRPTQ